LLSETPVKFTIHSSQQEELVTVKMSNAPVMGKISLEKRGEMLTGVREIDTAFGKQLVPIFEMKALGGAEFDIITAEDILTGDGTIRAKKGEVVGHLVTGKDGIETSGELFLGNYLVVETKAPAGFVLDTAKHPVSLVYEDQHTAVVSSQIGLDNVRQAVEIVLNKVMEKPIGAPEGFNPFLDVVFGIFAAEKIQDIIPKDALVGTITLDDNGRGTFDGDLPFGKFYVRELQTSPYYQLNETKYPVDVIYAGQDVAVTKIQVNDGTPIPNELKLGKIVVEKQGEMLVGATKTKDGYTPVYELRGLPCAIFDIITAEDIYDVSGKLLMKKGTVVDTITTGADGKAESKDGYAIFKDVAFGEYEIRELSAPVGYMRSEDVLRAIVGKDGSVVLFEITNERIPGEPVEQEEPEVPVAPDEPLPKTGDSKTIVVVALVVLILAGGAVLWLRKRRKNEDEATEEPAEKE